MNDDYDYKIETWFKNNYEWLKLNNYIIEETDDMINSSLNIFEIEHIDD